MGIYGSPDLTEHKTNNTLQHTKLCKHCGAFININDKRCRYCRRKQKGSIGLVLGGVFVLLLVLIVLPLGSSVDLPYAERENNGFPPLNNAVRNYSGNYETNELINYMEGSHRNFAIINSDIIERFNRLADMSFNIDSSNVAMSKIVNDSANLIAEAEAITIENRDIRELHEIFIRTLNVRHSAFVLFLGSINENDQIKIVEANEKLSEYRMYNREFQAKLREVAKKFNVTLLE